MVYSVNEIFDMIWDENNLRIIFFLNSVISLIHA